MTITSVSAAPAVSHLPPSRSNVTLDDSLRGHLATNADIVSWITKPVRMNDIGALSAQSEQPILFENIIEKPGFRRILVKTRRSHRTRARRSVRALFDDALLLPAASAPPRPQTSRPGRSRRLSKSATTSIGRNCRSRVARTDEFP